MDGSGTGHGWAAQVPDDHPDRDLLRRAAQALAELDRISGGSVGDRTGEAAILQETIEDEARFLASLEHRVAYLGPAGAGKTTLLSYQVGLVQRSGPKRDPRKDPVLTVSPGSTTLCEVAVRRADRAAITIEPLPPRELDEALRSFCSDVWDASRSRPASDPTDVDASLPAELDRAVRNMAGLTSADDESDPAADLARAHAAAGFDAFLAAVRAAVDPERRTTTYLPGPECGDPEQTFTWLRRVFREINDGRHRLAPLPRRLLVEAPQVRALTGGFEVELVDTMGVSGITIRQDMLDVLRDPRCVPVLCAPFGNAPPGPPLLHLLHHVRELGMEGAVQRRGALLVLTRGDEAEWVRDPATGEAVGDAPKGRMLKAKEAAKRLRSVGMGDLEVTVFDVATDDLALLDQALRARIEAERASHAAVLAKAVDAVAALARDDGTGARIEAAAHCATALEQFTAEFAELAPRARNVESEVTRGIRDSHPQTVRASVRRRGQWRNLDLVFLTAAGAASEAGVRSSDARTALLETLEGLRAVPIARPIDGVLASLVSRADRWFGAFLDAARAVGSEVFGARLVEDTALWDTCGELHGRGYVGAIGAEVGAWFAENDRRLLQRALDARLQQLWARHVIAKVQETVARLRWTPSVAGTLQPPPDPRLDPDTESYHAFTRDFDEEVHAGDLVDAEELARLSAELEAFIDDGTDPPILSEHAVPDLRDAVVTLLVDHSGSMRGAPIRFAATLVRTVADALHRSGAAVEVLGFTTRTWKGGLARARWVEQGKPPSPGRLADLRHIIYHEGSAPWSDEGRGALGLMLHEGVLKENIDGEALLWAYRRSLALPAARRAIILLTDGAPVDDSTLSVNPGNYLEKHLRSVVAAIEDQRVVGLGAVGIGHEVERYFAASICFPAVETADVTRVLDLVMDVFPNAA